MLSEEGCFTKAITKFQQSHHLRFAALALGVISVEPPPCTATAHGASLLQGQCWEGDGATSPAMPGSSAGAHLCRPAWAESFKGEEGIWAPGTVGWQRGDLGLGTWKMLPTALLLTRIRPCLSR